MCVSSPKQVFYCVIAVGWKTRMWSLHFRCHPGGSRGPVRRDRGVESWVPAFAGMTAGGWNDRQCQAENPPHPPFGHLLPRWGEGDQVRADSASWASAGLAKPEIVG